MSGKTVEHVVEGDMNELLREGRTIQQHIPKSLPSMSNEHLARSFANLMLQGKTKPALCLLSEKSKGGVLHLNDLIETDQGEKKVRYIPADKHPPRQLAHPDTIINDSPLNIHVLYILPCSSLSMPP